MKGHVIVWINFITYSGQSSKWASILGDMFAHTRGLLHKYGGELRFSGETSHRSVTLELTGRHRGREASIRNEGDDYWVFAVWYVSPLSLTSLCTNQKNVSQRGNFYEINRNLGWMNS